jgi:hypothetical protein
MGASQRNNIPFPGLFVIYFAGLDKEAHIAGMSEYSKFFKGTTEDEVNDIVNWLKEHGEFDNKIFIIVSDHGMTAMPTDLTYERTRKWFDADGNEHTIVDYPKAEMSCKLKIDGFNKEKNQVPELSNNNLHIWELADVLRALNERKLELSYRVVAPKEISELFMDSPAGARRNLGLEFGMADFANVIAAFNGPMAHIYLRGADGWQTLPEIEEVKKFSEVLRILFQINDSAEARNALGIDFVDYNNLLENNVGRLEQSVDRILVRSSEGYMQFDGNGRLNPLSFGSEYINAADRSQKLNHSKRSGDIILIMKDKMTESADKRFTTGTACKSWHGSLNPSDSYVPFILAYPGGNNFEVEPLVRDTTGCTIEGCDGNWRVTDLIKTITRKQYTSE